MCLVARLIYIKCQIGARKVTEILFFSNLQSRLQPHISKQKLLSYVSHTLNHWRGSRMYHLTPNFNKNWLIVLFKLTLVELSCKIAFPYFEKFFFRKFRWKFNNIETQILDPKMVKVSASFV